MAIVVDGLCVQMRCIGSPHDQEEQMRIGRNEMMSCKSAQNKGKGVSRLVWPLNRLCMYFAQPCMECGSSLVRDLSPGRFQRLQIVWRPAISCLFGGLSSCQLRQD